MCGLFFIIVSLGADTVMREECVLCRVARYSSGVLTRRNEATQEYAEPSRQQAVGSGLRRGGVRLLSRSTVLSIARPHNVTIGSNFHWSAFN